MIEGLKRVFFLGIGGIGMSAIAKYLSDRDVIIFGYDRESTRLTKKLEALGMKICYELTADFVPDDIDVVIYTPAIKDDQQEYLLLKERNIPFMKRSEILREILDRHPVIAVAGTHGKTSTSAILAHLLKENGLLAGGFVGGLLKNYDSNFVSGEGDWIVVEADEYDRSFLRIFPDMAIIQAMDPDHLDIYGTAEEMRSNYRQFSLQIKRGGTIWLNESLLPDTLGIDWQKQLMEAGVKIESFGENAKSFRLISAKLTRDGRQQLRFQLADQEIELAFAMAGKHNLINALAAASVAFRLGVAAKEIVRSLESFAGIERRFEYVYRSETTVVIDDYAHHPVEIAAAILAARTQHPGKKLTVVFQPHLYSRTRDFCEEFARSLDAADEIMLAPLYPAREKPIAGVNSELLMSLMKSENVQLVDKMSITEKLKQSRTEVLLFLGAGDFNKEIKNVIQELGLN